MKKAQTTTFAIILLLVIIAIVGVYIAINVSNKPTTTGNVVKENSCPQVNFCPISYFYEQPKEKTFELKIPINEWKNGISTPQFPTTKYNCWNQLKEMVVVKDNEGFCKVNSFREYPEEISLDCECWYKG